MRKINKKEKVEAGWRPPEKNLKNPFLSKRTKKKRSGGNRIPLKYKLYVLFVVVIISGGIWFFFFCPVWTIEAVEIKGVDRVSEQEVKSMVTDQFQHKKLFLLKQGQLTVYDSEELKDKLHSVYEFEKVDIHKDWPDRLSLTIQESPCAYIWKEGGRLYYADKNGYILKRASSSSANTENENHPLIVNRQEESRAIDEKINIDQAYTEAVLSLKEHIDEYMDDFSVDEFVITKKMNILKVIPQKGPYLLFDVSEDIEGQVNNLITLKENKLKNEIYTKEYIDLSHGDMIYYR